MSLKPGTSSPTVTSTWLSPQLLAALARRAEAEGISKGELVTRAIAAYLEQREQTR